jgi:uncharacterized repeat protein (TIGR04076 family)
MDMLACRRFNLKGIYRLVITVKEIKGNCPVFSVGDRIAINEPEIIPEKTDAICVHALGSMLSMIIALSRGVSFKEPGLARDEEDVGYLQCLDPGPHTRQVEQLSLK